MEHVGICYKHIPSRPPLAKVELQHPVLCISLHKFHSTNIYKMSFTEVAEQYRAACARVAEAIRNSKYKAIWFIEGLGFGSSPSAYYRRLKSAEWEPEHLLKIGQLLEGKAV
jgi:hypothetical protein